MAPGFLTSYAFGFLTSYALGFLTRLTFGVLTRLSLGFLTRLSLGVLTRLSLGVLTRLSLGFLTRLSFGFLTRLSLGFLTGMALGFLTRTVLGFLTRTVLGFFTNFAFCFRNPAQTFDLLTSFSFGAFHRDAFSFEKLSFSLHPDLLQFALHNLIELPFERRLHLGAQSGFRFGAGPGLHFFAAQLLLPGARLALGFLTVSARGFFTSQAFCFFARAPFRLFPCAAFRSRFAFQTFDLFSRSPLRRFARPLGFRSGFTFGFFTFDQFRLASGQSFGIFTRFFLRFLSCGGFRFSSALKLFRFLARPALGLLPGFFLRGGFPFQTFNFTFGFQFSLFP